LEDICRDHDIMLVYKGTGIVTINGQEFCVERGDLITVYPGETFSAMALGSESFNRYYIHFDFFKEEGRKSMTPIIGDGARWPRLVRLVDDVEARELCHDIILHKLEADGICSRIIADGKLYALLGLILSQYQTPKDELNPQYGKSRRSILKAAKYIRDNYSRDISLEELANLAGLSVNYFGTVFKGMLGKSPIEYLIDYRLMQAKRLLLETEFNISEVARMVGYEEARYFSSVFRQREGISPSEFVARFVIEE
jgi:AraC-like DNA-binding protein